jgi:hypothetical protein
MATQTFELVSPFLTIYAPSKVWEGDASLLRGQTANRLVTGELLEITGARGVKRPEFTGIAGEANAALDLFVAPYFSETGRGDIVTGGAVPILQFGPFEADTMLFERAGDDTFDADGEGEGSLAQGKIGAIDVGLRVFAMSVRNPLNGATFNSGNYVTGVGASVGAIESAFCVGRVSRIIGSGASQKIRVLFGIN